MSEPIHVLIFPAGEQNATEAIQALSSQVNVLLFGCGARDGLAPYFLRRYRSSFPTLDDPSFIDRVNSISAEWKIDLILPTHDAVVSFLADHRQSLRATPMVPSARTSAICRDKSLFYEMFRASGFVPEVIDVTAARTTHHVWVKPRTGQGAVGGRRLQTSDSGWRRSIDWQSEVVTEYLPGDEMTVDCFSSFESELQGVFPRTRDRTLGGISVAGSTVEATPELTGIASEINDRLGFVGMWYFQAKKDSGGSWKVMEVSARIPGGQALTRARGVNLPLLSVYAHSGIPTRVFINDPPVRNERFLSSVFSLGFSYDRVYLDLDDTLIVDGQPDVDLVGLLYQWASRGQKVTLITRHNLDPLRTLDKHRIHQGLIAEVISVPGSETKSTFIDPAGSIFIDNSFSEREEVHNAHRIPVFDVSDVAALRDWKR